MIRGVIRGVYHCTRQVMPWVTIQAAKLGLVIRYQPIFGEKSVVAERLCDDRWEVIASHLPRREFSFLDVGSQLGYFVFRATEAGAFAIGIERCRDYFDVANAIGVRQGIGQAAFINMEVNTKSVVTLPHTDVLCCLSVYHHWVREWGAIEADKILTELCNRTELLFFETGQSDEQGVSWSRDMSFMDADPEGWLKSHLESKGFQSVVTLGTYKTHLSDVPRFLMMASKKKKVAAAA